MRATGTGTELSTDLAEVLRAEGEELPPGIGPYQLAWRRLRRNKVALAFGGLFLLVVILCLLAPVYAHDIAHTGPNDEHIDTALSKVGLPIGPTWTSKFFLCADDVGRDGAARQQGLSHVQIMVGEILPNVASTIIVFVPLVLANAVLTEAGLSFLGAGVRPPNPSWGTMISENLQFVPAVFHPVLVPGLMLVL